MRTMLTLGLAIVSASVVGAAAASAAPAPEVRPDTIIRVQGRPPPWAQCVRWNRRSHVCMDNSWRSRNWRRWYGRSSCRRGNPWWIDSWGRWRRCRAF